MDFNIQNVYSKIRAYVGFCIKGNMLVYGIDNIFVSRKIKLIILSKELSKKSKERIKKQTTIPIIEDYDFSTLTVNANCKAFGVIDKGLSNAINETYKMIKE